MPDHMKIQEARTVAGLSKDWVLDSVIKDAIAKYESFDTPIIKLLKASYVLIGKLEQDFLNIDLDERDEKGRKVNDAAKSMGNLKSLGGVVSGIDALLEQVRKEQAAKSRARGGGQAGAFENPD
jgi:hypothetical protein